MKELRLKTVDLGGYFENEPDLLDKEKKITQDSLQVAARESLRNILPIMDEFTGACLNLPTTSHVDAKVAIEEARNKCLELLNDQWKDSPIAIDAGAAVFYEPVPPKGHRDVTRLALVEEGHRSPWKIPCHIGTKQATFQVTIDVFGLEV